MPRAQDLVVLREILQRELETINAYEAMLDRVQDPALRQIIEHVTDEEREHVAEMYQLIMARDPRQQERAQRSEEQLGRMHAEAAAAHAQAAAAPQASPASPMPPPSNEPSSGGALLGEQTAVAAAGLGEPLLGQRSADPVPPPAPIFPDGSWSVGSLKTSGKTSGKTPGGRADRRRQPAGEPSSGAPPEAESLTAEAS